MRGMLRHCDLLPAWLALVLGGVLAVVPSWLLASGSHAVGAVGCALLLGLAARLAISGQPVEELPRVRSQGPVPDGQEGALPKVTLPEMVPIPGGSFRMGSPDDEEGRYDDEGPVHTVHVSAFECGRYSITRRLYKEIIGEDPGWPEGEADDRPLNNVSWLDAVRFCNQLSENAGLERCYEIDGNEARWNESADGFRLLTEAEWEYAARAGTTTRWSFGDDEADLEQHGWYGKNSGGEPHSAGALEPNPWGLFDMHGNVWEWCWDRFGDYSAEDQIDPSGPERGSGRVLRGGSFNDSARILRSAFRDRNWPVYRDRDLGFRCARGPRRQH